MRGMTAGMEEDAKKEAPNGRAPAIALCVHYGSAIRRFLASVSALQSAIPAPACRQAGPCCRSFGAEDAGGGSIERMRASQMRFSVSLAEAALAKVRPLVMMLNASAGLPALSRT